MHLLQDKFAQTTRNPAMSSQFNRSLAYPSMTMCKAKPAQVAKRQRTIVGLECLRISEAKTGVSGCREFQKWKVNSSDANS